jgi:hypothetical protein
LASLTEYFRDRTEGFWVDVCIHVSILAAMVVSAVAILWVG